MACTEEYIQFVCSQLGDVGSTRAKKMFGEWLIYIDEKPAVLGLRQYLLCEDASSHKPF